MSFLLKTWKIFLELLFPSGKLESRVREMTQDDFIVRKKLLDENGVISFFKYKDPIIREAIRQFKYKKNNRITKIIALIIYSEILEEISELSLFENFEKPVFVPIPMERIERSQRGYNQVELLIKEIVNLDEKSFSYDFSLLKKIERRPRQTDLKREERLKNVKGVFEASKNASKNVRGKNIILLDDVMTTGATISEARGVLEKAGARKVLAIVVAK